MGMVRTNLCTDKNMHGSTLRLHRTGEIGGIFERPSVQVWDLKQAQFHICMDSCENQNRASFLLRWRGYGLESNAVTGLNFAWIRLNTTTTEFTLVFSILLFGNHFKEA